MFRGKVAHLIGIASAKVANLQILDRVWVRGPAGTKIFNRNGGTSMSMNMALLGG
jgi:NAD(P)H-flavin reductase